MSDFRFNDEVKVAPVKRFDELRKEIQLQSATVFNDKNIKPAECMDILVNLIYLLNKGENFTDEEKENLFFNVSKLLHSNNNSLRRLTYLFVMHLNFWKNSFILTGSLITEINKSDDNSLKPNCFRLLGQIIDASSVSVVERLLKIAISNQNTEIASNAIICSLFMMFKGFNVAKSWIQEIADKLTSSIGQENLLTFHTLLLLKQVKQSDKLFLIKMYTKIIDNKNNNKSQFAICQLIRYITDIMLREELETNVTNTFYSFLERTIYNVEDSIKIEGCRAVLKLPKVKAALKKAAIGTIYEFLRSTSKILRYAALKTLNKYISKNAQSVATDIFLDIEKLIEDTSLNSSIKANALSIFLKISKGLSDFRLEKMFKTFIQQYPKFKEEFKKEVVIISKSISRENTQKNKLYYNFFCSLFKFDSNIQTKLELLDAIVWFIYNDESLKTQAVLFLAEFISECQYEEVKIRILNILGKECKLVSPGKLIRYIVNQINLETPMIRASAICALGEIGYKEPSQRETIMKYIKRSFTDNDNEVRERAFFYYKGLSELELEKTDEKPKASSIIFTETNKGLNIELLQSVLKYEKENLLRSSNISEDLNSIMNNEEKISEIMMKNKMNEKKAEESKKEKGSVKKEEEAQDEYKKTTFSKVYGQPKIVTPYKRLTDQTAEYKTSYRKIVHDKIVVIDFEVTNTIELQTISNVTIDIDDFNGEGFEANKTEIIEIEKLATNQSGHLYLKLLKTTDFVFSNCSFKITLKFDLQELDVKGNPHGIAVKEQYKIDKVVEVSYADYFIKNNKVNLNNFTEIWKMAENSNYKKTEEKMVLPAHNIKAAAKHISEIMGLMPLNDIDTVEQNAKRFEFVYAYISYFESLLFVKFQVIFNDKNQCLAQVVVLSQDEEIPEMISNKIYA